MKVRIESEIQCRWIVDGWIGAAHCTLLTVAYKPYLFHRLVFSWSMQVGVGVKE